MFDTRASKQDGETKGEDVLAVLPPPLSSSPSAPSKSHHLPPTRPSNATAQPPNPVGSKSVPAGAGSQHFSLLKIPTLRLMPAQQGGISTGAQQNAVLLCLYGAKFRADVCTEVWGTWGRSLVFGSLTEHPFVLMSCCKAAGSTACLG